MAERIYVVGGPTGIHLVNSSTKQGAIAYVAHNVYKATVATQNDLVELISKGVKVEHAKANNMELDLEEPK
jgi:hypothetical protein